jgi:hypothetical protein
MTSSFAKPRPPEVDHVDDVDTVDTVDPVDPRNPRFASSSTLSTQSTPSTKQQLGQCNASCPDHDHRDAVVHGVPQPSPGGPRPRSAMEIERDRGLC